MPVPSAAFDAYLESEAAQRPVRAATADDRLRPSRLGAVLPGFAPARPRPSPRRSSRAASRRGLQAAARRAPPLGEERADALAPGRRGRRQRGASTAPPGSPRLRRASWTRMSSAAISPASRSASSRAASARSRSSSGEGARARWAAPPRSARAPPRAPARAGAGARAPARSPAADLAPRSAPRTRSSSARGVTGCVSDGGLVAAQRSRSAGAVEHRLSRPSNGRAPRPAGPRNGHLGRP